MVRRNFDLKAAKQKETDSIYVFVDLKVQILCEYLLTLRKNGKNWRC